MMIPLVRLWPSFGMPLNKRGPKYNLTAGARFITSAPASRPMKQRRSTALQARVAELEAETKKAKFIHQYEVKELQARANKLTRLVETLVENDPEDMAADAVTVLDVWRKEARELLARHARLDARQAGMEKMRENESAEIRAALEGKKE